MSKLTAGAEFDQVDQKDLPKFLSLFAQDVQNNVNGKLDFISNFGAKIVSFNFTAMNTDLTVQHGLGRTVVGYIPIGYNAAAQVYTGSSAPTNSALTLRATAVAVVSVLVF